MRDAILHPRNVGRMVRRPQAWGGGRLRSRHAWRRWGTRAPESAQADFILELRPRWRRWFRTAL